VLKNLSHGWVKIASAKRAMTTVGTPDRISIAVLMAVLILPFLK
jgi:hypothetical protein